MMMRQRIETIITTVLLLGAGIVARFLLNDGHIEGISILTTLMPFATAIYVFGGCMLQTFGFRKLAIILGIIVFVVLCTCLFYTSSLIDYIIFFVCMALVIRKSSHVCNCNGTCNNPFR